MCALKREDVILAALSAGPERVYTPVQIQKLMFILDRRIPNEIGGPHFNFEPYDYGPFDNTIYANLEWLSTENFLEIDYNKGVRKRTYRLLQKGFNKGQEHLKTLDEKTRKYIEKVASFVLRVSFAELVSAIYRAYPEMKVNSVFKS